MENKKKKCSKRNHENNELTIFCQECQIYMCNKCENLHSELFINHHQIKLENDIQDIFTGICKVEGHKNKLEYFCRDHCELCCGLCISKIKGKGNGNHIDCDICFIEDIKDEKKNKLEENLTYLENLSKTIDKSINRLKDIFNEVNKNKEELKLKIQKIFTQIRNAINNREDELLLEIDNKFDNLYFSEDLIKKSEKLDKKVKLSLEAGKKLNNEWDNDSKLSLLINDCINIEMNINDINIINNNIGKI